VAEHHPDLNPQKALIWRIVHRDNLPWILDNGLHCDKRLGDAGPLDVIWFDDERKTFVHAYLKSEAKEYVPALEATAALIDGFESPYGMELLATVNWLLTKEGVAPTVITVREGLRHWRGGADAAARKDRLFSDRVLGIALERLTSSVPALA
jgi:hypothetical protein